MTEQLKIVNTATNASITLDQKASIYLLDQVDWGVVESNHQSYKYINQIGVYVTGSTLETRSINILGWITGKNNDELKYKRSTLNTMINPMQLHMAIIDEYKLEFLPTSSVKYSVSYQENNEVMCRFMISGFCPDPLFAKLKENRVEAATTYPKFRFPLMIPKGIPGIRDKIIMGLREPSLLVNIHNDGDVPTGMRIEFSANATVKNPSLTDAVTMQYIKINKTLTAGEKVVVVTQDGKKRVNGIANNIQSNYYRYRDLNSSWLQLQVGDNLFQYSAEGNVDGLEVILYFSSRYLEVE